MQRFCDININILNRHAPRKRKLARGNQMPFITKDLSKAIMKRSGLSNNFFKNRTEENKTLSGDYMIPVSRDEILLQTLHKLHPAITCKTFRPGKTGSLFCKAGIPLFRDEIFPCNRFGLPRRDKKVN